MAASPPTDAPALPGRLRLLPRRLLLTVACVMAASALALALGEVSFNRALATGERINAVLERRDAAAEARLLLADLEAGQRGFLLTRDPIYLGGFEAARLRFAGTFGRLEALSPAPADRDRVAALRATAGERLAMAERSVAAARGGDFAAATAMVQEGAAKVLMERFQAGMAAVDAASEAELAALRASQARATFWPRLATLVSTLLVFGLLIAVTRSVLDEAGRQRSRALERQEEAARVAQAVAARTAGLSALSAHLQSASEREKAELARHLHDELGGLLTAARMDLSWLQGATRDLDPGIGARLRQLNQAFTQAMDVKRRAVESLRPALLDHFGLPAALQNHFEEVCGKAGLDCLAEVDDEVPALPAHVAIALFRVGQECLANIVRHARARTVELSLAASGEAIVLRIRDDGAGMDAAAVTQASAAGTGGLGIAGMRLRIESLGGTFVLRSAPGRGTELEIAVPLPPAPAGAPPGATRSSAAAAPARATDPDRA